MGNEITESLRIKGWIDIKGRKEKSETFSFHLFKIFFTHFLSQLQCRVYISDLKQNRRKHLTMSKANSQTKIMIAIAEQHALGVEAPTRKLIATMAEMLEVSTPFVAV